MTLLQPLHGGQLRRIVDHFGIHGAEVLDFSANINPEGPPAAVVRCLRASLDNPSALINYPDLDETDLRQSLAQYAGVRSENVSVANGFVPLLDTVLRVLALHTCLVPVPAFVEYRKTLERARIELLPHSVSTSPFRYDPDDLLTGSHHAVLLANPQNPSGVLSPRDSLLRLVEDAAARNIYILLDEAFVDYCPEASLTREIDHFPNLIVFRSVTKFFGMAGLRVAYAVAHAELSRRLHETIAPWSVTTLASIAASVAVQDEAYARHTIALNSERRGRLQAAIEKLGIYVYPSAANFLLLRLPPSIESQKLWRRLIREHHIVLRNCANYEALSDGHLRAAVRTDSENERLIQALEYEIARS
jgi:threonine-phosphate decarboxylase